MKIKTVHVLLALMLLIVPVLSVGSVAAQDEITINLAFMQQAGVPPEELDKLVAAYEEANPNINIEITYVAYPSLHDLLVTSISSNPPAFDVVLVDDIWYAEFADNGWLLDISDRITDDMRAGIFESAWGISTVNDVAYGMPWMLDQKYFFYNTRILAEAGFDAPPATWEEMAEQARVIKEKGLVEYPMMMSWAQVEAVICDFVTLLYGNGAEFFDAEGNPVFNSEAGVQALQWMVDMVNEGIVNPSSIASDEMGVENVFLQGSAAFVSNWLFMYNDTQNSEDSKVVGEVGMSLMPVFAATAEQGTSSATINGSMGISITAGTEHPDEVWAFLEYLTSPETQVSIAAWQSPIWQAAAEDPSVVEANPVTAPIFAAQFPFAHVRPKVPYYNEASRIVQTAIQEALTGAKTPQEALDSAVEQIQEVAAE